MSDVEMIDEDLESSSHSEEDESEDENNAYNDNLDNPFIDDFADDGENEGPIQTSFDHYFMLSSRKLQTSSNVFSRAVPPIDREAFFNTVKSMKQPKETKASLEELHKLFQKMTPKYLLELTLGYNLMFYGPGSKWTALNEFAKLCARSGHVFVANGFLQEFSLKSFFIKIDDTLEISSPPLESPQVESHCRRLCTLQSKPHAKRLILILHNIDVIGVRNIRAKKCIQILNSCPNIHIAASMDNIMAPLMWADTAPIPDTSQSATSDISSRAISWLWHDATTFQPYDVELANIDRTNFAGAHVFKKTAKRKAGAGAAGTHEPISETAAHHVLAAVTEKAKRLFVLLGQRQLDTLAESDTAQPQEAGMSYERLFTSARDDFIATNDTALRALLGEFRDHGMIASANAAEGGETLWIPMPKESLARVLKTLQSS
ncbi:origin recognition complex subunit 2 [Schizopora paradoxa]|uniref:Origin recognition complex subunit 2 n=1 Tax=Schizopora paradoxa TaxID=27342 RepID=A0A0H2RUP9_9AGAM|nr:origin recognition complex subunit 2 [Schizopora paradoxa]